MLTIYVVSSYSLVLKTYLQSRRNSGHVRFFIGLNGELRDTASLSYEQRIQNLQDEIERLKKEQSEMQERVSDCKKSNSGDSIDTKRT